MNSGFFLSKAAIGKIKIGGALLTNGSLEDGTTGWTLGGNVAVNDNNGGLYEPTDGDYLAVFNGGDTPANGSLTQTITVEDGEGYTITFDVGIVAYHTRKVEIAVVIDSAAGPPPHLLYATIERTGVGSGINVWGSTESFNFTADGTTALIQFYDITSENPDAGDLMLDNITVTLTP